MKGWMRSALLAALAGVLLGVGSRVPALWMCSLISFAPLLYVLARAASIRAAFRLAFIAGMCAYGLSFHAIFWDALPLTWLGISGPVGVLLIGMIWSITTLSYAATFGVAMTIAYRLKAVLDWRALLVIPSLYVLADWVATWAFSIINYGHDALLGPNFTMGSPAYQLAADGALLQLASVGGVYLLAFAQAFLGVVICRACMAGKQERIRLIAVGCMLFGVWAFGTWWFAASGAEPSAKPIHVALITRFEPAVLVPSDAALKRDFADMRQVIAHVAAGTDVIVLPEDTRFLLMWHALEKQGEAPALPHGTVILDSASEYESDNHLYSRLETYDTASSTAFYAYKLYLMPFGEYLPYFYQSLARAIGEGAIVDTLLGVRDFHIRTQPIVPVLIHGVPSIAMLCSEAMSPYLYADGARNGAEVLYNLASHSWFHGSRTLYALALWTGRVRAVESGRWYVRAADGTPSFILDPYGRITLESNWDESGVSYGSVYPRAGQTPYLLFGQWMLLVPFLILAGAAGWHYRIAGRHESA